MTNRSDTHKLLEILGLDHQEAEVYLTLLADDQSHLHLSRATGINRTSIYRLVDGLLARGLLETVTSERGKLLRAAPPATLDRLVRESELRVEQQRRALVSLTQKLERPEKEDEFSVRTYHTKEGLKQMLWKELATKSEILIFSHQDSLNIVFGRSFANKFRHEIIRRNIKQRSLHNSHDEVSAYTELPYQKHYQHRVIDPKLLKISQEVTVLSDRVNVYNWERRAYVGTEIHNPAYATFMRNVFEGFWRQAGG